MSNAKIRPASKPAASEEAEHRQIGGVSQELAALESFEELRMNFYARNSTLAVGRRDAIIGGGYRRDTDENNLAVESGGQAGMVWPDPSKKSGESDPGE